jgi:hypothetical protein
MMKFLIFLSVVVLLLVVCEWLGKLLEPYIKSKNIPDHPLSKIADQRERESIGRNNARGCCCNCSCSSFPFSWDHSWDDWDSGLLNDDDDNVVNPATGLMMMGGMGGVDSAGNMFGCDNSQD